MNDIRLEAQLVAARNHQSDQPNHFVKDTMRKIEQLSQVNRKLAPPKQGFVFWVKHLSKPALALFALIAITLVSGAVYAAVHFAPALIQILSKETNQRGATEYSVAGFANCAKDNAAATERFEITKDAPPLSDEDVRNLLQAKCELAWVNGFVSDWPTYGTQPEWKDGDTIYYARPDALGKVTHLTQTNVRLAAGRSEPIEYTVVEGEKLKAYQGGNEVSLNQIQPGDTVFSIIRASETYRDLTQHLGNTKESTTFIEMPGNNPKVVGLLALFKLSLPEKYYGEMQNYIIEVPACVGNDHEYCPSTPSVDVYPRGDGEESTNPHLQMTPDGAFREISGVVTELNDDTLTLKSRQGNMYTVSVGDAGFATYNRDYATHTTDTDAALKVGSHIAVRYQQPKDADPKTVTKEQVIMVVLQLEGVNPRKNIKPY